MRTYSPSGLVLAENLIRQELRDKLPGKAIVSNKGERLISSTQFP